VSGATDPRLRALLRRTLGAAPDGLGVPALLAAVRAAGAPRLARAELERALAADPACVAADLTGRPAWRLDPDAVARETAAADPTGSAVDPVTSRAGLDALALRDWQVAALAAWSARSAAALAARYGPRGPG
jgi:hypothetical protein